MIRNNTITHEDLSISRLEIVDFNSTVFKSVFIAVITTLLSYQLSAAFFDIFLGRRRYLPATAPDIHIQLLSYEPYLLSVLSALLRIDSLDRARLRCNIPGDFELPRVKESIPKRIFCKCLLLLLAAPLFNFISVSFTVERDRTYSFDDAGFGGIALGYNHDSSLVSFRESAVKRCRILSWNSEEPISPVASFWICRTRRVTGVRDLGGNERVGGGSLLITLSTTAQGGIVFLAEGKEPSLDKMYYVETEMISLIRTDNNLWRLAQRFDDEDGKRILISVRKRLESRYCNGTLTTGNTYPTMTTPYLKYSEYFNCEPSWVKIFDPAGTFYLEGITKHLIDKLTLVNDKEVLVADDNSLDRNFSGRAVFKNGGNLPLLKHRRSVMSSGTIIIMILFVCLFRLSLGIFVKNGAEEAIENMISLFGGRFGYESFMRNDFKWIYLPSKDSGEHLDGESVLVDMGFRLYEDGYIEKGDASEEC